MTIVVALFLIAAGVGAVAIARPKDGVTRPFLKGTFMEMLYPVFCLGLLVFGASILIAELAL
jgi:hypothetical protein